MKQFLSCDWGTSSFRLKLVEVPSLRTLAELQNSHGIASTNSNWRKEGGGQNRFLFFAGVIASAIDAIEGKINGSLDGIPVILSGMASSTLGMIELPYKQLPFKTDGSDLKVEQVKASKDFEHDVFVVSGVCSDVDVMRGEETQLVGAVEGESDTEIVYIFPGTHSKHITVKNGIAHEFRTYMTGEIFSLLSRNSTLSQSVADALEFNNENFIAGVKDATNSNLLHQLFRVRSRFLLDKKKPEENSSYLSGLLIGHEVQELSRGTVDRIVIVSSGMGDNYTMAMETLNIPRPISIIGDNDVAIRGQFKIVSHFV